MMLSGIDIITVVGVSAGVTAIVAAAVLFAVRINRRGSLTTQLFLVACTAPVAITASVVIIAAQMYVSEHDLQVLVWVAAIATVMSLVAVAVVGRAARMSIGSLQDSVRRVGRGEVVGQSAAVWREVAEVSDELAATSASLAEARAEINRLDTARRQFFAWISHDLRTPLTGLRAVTEVLEAGAAEDPSDSLRHIRLQVDAMNRLVDDLFELSMLGSDTIQLHCEPVDLLDIVSDAVSDVAHLAAEREIAITRSGIAGHLLWADPHELTRVVVNLLTNSIRHAPKGSEVHVSATRDAADRLVFCVLDQGDGVATEDLGHIFEVGWRSDEARTPASTSGATGGAGLGLAIVYGIIEAHGGDVTAENVDDGFLLKVVLPTAPTD